MSQSKCRILCVDDHKDTAEMLSLLLAREDYEVLTATTATESLELAEDKEFDLYVLDKRLPDGDGLTLCKQLNKITPNSPCLFYSGDADESHRREAIDAGVAAYVIKPDIEGLIAGVHKLLAGKECATSA